MQDIPPIEPTPVLKDKKCLFLAYLIFFLLSFTPVIVGVYAAFEYDLFIGAGFALFLWVVSGIVASKMKFSSVSADQIEMSHSYLDIAKRFVNRHLC